MPRSWWDMTRWRAPWGRVGWLGFWRSPKPRLTSWPAVRSSWSATRSRSATRSWSATRSRSATRSWSATRSRSATSDGACRPGRGSVSRLLLSPPTCLTQTSRLAQRSRRAQRSRLAPPVTPRQVTRMSPSCVTWSLWDSLTMLRATWSRSPGHSAAGGVVTSIGHRRVARMTRIRRRWRLTMMSDSSRAWRPRCCCRGSPTQR